jgi:hypothetical protein
MYRQIATLSKRLAAASLSTQKWFYTRMRTKVRSQIASFCKRLSATWLNTRKWLFASMRSKVFSQMRFS